MKNRIGIFSFLHFLVLLSYAQQPKQNGYVISGHIGGVEKDTKIYLLDLDAQIMRDSIVTTNGDFTFRGHVERPSTFRIHCENEYAIIQVENTRIEFNSPLKDMYLRNKVKGGKEQDLHNELTALQRPYDKIYLAIRDSIVNNKFTDEEHRKKLAKTHNSYVDSSQRIYVEFGKKHPNSYLGLDILYRNRQRIGKDTINSLLARMDKSIRSTPKAKALEIFVESELAEKGKHFIDFEAKTINGSSFKLSSLKGNYILLSFWEAGCGPCRIENRKISKDYNRIKEKFAIVSFSMDKSRSSWLKASKEDNVLWTNVSDLQGEAGKIKTQYDVQAMPTSFLINKEGIIIEKFVGFDDDFLEQLEKLVSK